MSVLSSDIKVAFDEYTAFEKRRVKCKHCNWDVARNPTRQKAHLERDCEEYREWRVRMGTPLALHAEANGENGENSLNLEAKDSKRRKIGGINGSTEDIESENRSNNSISGSINPSKQFPKSGIHIFRTTPRVMTEPLALNTSNMVSNNSPAMSLDAPILVSPDPSNTIFEEQAISNLSSESLEIRERKLELAERELDLRQRMLQVRREELELMKLEKELLATPK